MSITVNQPDLTVGEHLGLLAELMTDGGFPITARELGESLDALYEKWGMDSLGHLELMVTLSRKFGVTISDADAEDLRTPAATVRFMNALRRGDG
ncbi:acyl carrier protein [Amycolatopsis sp. H20-H5]|uniref:acyl carrier protein n=1 Tax=Amycolatopsis sp. H20-H5 TaxID=3046309 RepID=UPI002DB9A100|nr:acyl carrier protein [Amycolatopsis sp. H20-H5]MEC3974253.1 acyl carrier protein [Amycolatopsis sp. H20-H5]